MKPLRSVAGAENCDEKQHATDEQILEKLKVPSLEATMLQHRVRCAGRLTKWAPPHLKRLMLLLTSAQASWTHKCINDPQVVWMMSEQLRAMISEQKLHRAEAAHSKTKGKFRG